MAVSPVLCAMDVRSLEEVGEEKFFPIVHLTNSFFHSVSQSPPPPNFYIFCVNLIGFCNPRSMGLTVFSGKGHGDHGILVQGERSLSLLGPC